MHDIDGFMADGSVKQDGMNFRPRSQKPGEDAGYIPFPVEGQVTAIYTVEDEKNRDSETVLLDIRVSDLGIDLFKVPWVGSQKGSVDNYIHFAPKPATGNVDKSLFNNLLINPGVSNGDTVLVVFPFGRLKQGKAITTLPHNQTQKLDVNSRPTKLDGDVYKVRFNGTNFFIDKDGNMVFETTPTVDKTTPAKKKFSFILKDAEDTNQKVEFFLDNSVEGQTIQRVTGEDGKIHVFQIDHATKTITLSSQNDNGENKIVMDPDKILIETPKLVQIVAGENAQFDVTGTTQINSSDKITVMGSAAIEINGGAAIDIIAGADCNVTASGNVVVMGAQIQLNGSAGQVLTTLTDPVIDLITGAPTTGVPTVLAG